jgi:hypothetical protein
LILIFKTYNKNRQADDKNLRSPKVNYFDALVKEKSVNGRFESEYGKKSQKYDLRF